MLRWIEPPFPAILLSIQSSDYHQPLATPNELVTKLLDVAQLSLKLAVRIFHKVAVLWKIRENRLAAKAAYLEAKATEGQAYNKGLTKYEMGPADPQEILELVNQERARIGVAPLVMDENVQKLSLIHI